MFLRLQFLILLIVLPRILFDRFTDKDFSKLLTHEDEKQNVVRLIAETCQRYSFNGIVLEIWTQLAARVDDHHLIDLVKSIGKSQSLISPLLKFVSYFSPNSTKPSHGHYRRCATRTQGNV